METLARRDEGILRAAGVRVRGARRALEETAILEMLFDRVAGHLLNAPNMMDGVSAGKIITLIQSRTPLPVIGIVSVIGDPPIINHKIN